VSPGGAPGTAPPELIAIHTNMPGTIPPEIVNTAVSSARLYWEFRQTAKAGFFDAKGVTIPSA